MLSLALSAHYRNEPRINIPYSNDTVQYVEFGEVLMGFHHGHKIKTKDVANMLIADRGKALGRVSKFYYYFGHIHHLTREETGGIVCESFRTLAARDAWHHQKGYRSQRDMCAIVHNKYYGEQQRHTVSADYLLDDIKKTMKLTKTKAKKAA